MITNLFMFIPLRNKHLITGPCNKSNVTRIGIGEVIPYAGANTRRQLDSVALTQIT